MSVATAAGRTEVTWNPVTGCGQRTSGRRGAITVHEARLEEPLRWRTPRMAHVGTGDIGHRGVPRPAAARMWAAMALTARHTFEVPASRPGRLATLLASPRFRREVAQRATDLLGSRPWQRWQLDLGGERVAGDSGRGGGWTTAPTRYGNLWSPPWPLPNVWVGTLIEDDDDSWRVDELRLVPAAVRFVRLDPLLGPVPSLDLTGIDWVIVGEATGRASQPLDLAWVRDIRDLCVSTETAFFFKRAGGQSLRAGSRELDGRTWDQVPAAGRQDRVTMVSSLVTDPDAAGLHEVFAVPFAGGWAVGEWCVSPKLGDAGRWFACFWDGNRTWRAMRGTFPAEAPEGTAVFPSLKAAELALRGRGYGERGRA